MPVTLAGKNGLCFGRPRSDRRKSDGRRMINVPIALFIAVLAFLIGVAVGRFLFFQRNVGEVLVANAIAEGLNRPHVSLNFPKCRALEALWLAVARSVWKCVEACSRFRVSNYQRKRQQAGCTSIRFARFGCQTRWRRRQRRLWTRGF